MQRQFDEEAEEDEGVDDGDASNHDQPDSIHINQLWIHQDNGIGTTSMPSGSLIYNPPQAAQEPYW